MPRNRKCYASPNTTAGERLDLLAGPLGLAALQLSLVDKLEYLHELELDAHTPAEEIGTNIDIVLIEIKHSTDIGEAIDQIAYRALIVGSAAVHLLNCAKSRWAKKPQPQSTLERKIDIVGRLPQFDLKARPLAAAADLHAAVHEGLPVSDGVVSLSTPPTDHPPQVSADAALHVAADVTPSGAAVGEAVPLVAGDGAQSVRIISRVYLFKKVLLKEKDTKNEKKQDDDELTKLKERFFKRVKTAQASFPQHPNMQFTSVFQPHFW